MNVKDMAVLNSAVDGKECYSISTIAHLLGIDYITAYYFLTNEYSDFEPNIIIGKCKTYSRWYSRDVVENLYIFLASIGYDVKQPEFHDKQYRPSYYQTYADASESQQYVEKYVLKGMEKYCDMNAIYKGSFLMLATKKRLNRLLRKVRKLKVVGE